MNNQGTAGTLVGPWIGEATPPSRRWTLLLLALLAGAALGSGITALSNARNGAPPEPEAVAREWPRRELPPEWRWAPPRVRTEQMFRKGAGAPARSMFRTR